MLEHFPLGLHNPMKAWVLLTFLATLFVFGIWRRNGWLSVAAGIAVLSTLVSWHYGYTLPPRVLVATDTASFWFGIFSLVMFFAIIYRNERKDAS